MEKIRLASRQRKLDFCIAANMFDETKLPFDKLTRKRRCLVWFVRGTQGSGAKIQAVSIKEDYRTQPSDPSIRETLQHYKLFAIEYTT